jgi:hypothetical protein
MPPFAEAFFLGIREPESQIKIRKVMEMKKLIHKFDITYDDLGLQLNINNL